MKDLFESVFESFTCQSAAWLEDGVARQSNILSSALRNSKLKSHDFMTDGALWHVTGREDF